LIESAEVDKGDQSSAAGVYVGHYLIGGKRMYCRLFYRLQTYSVFDGRDAKRAKSMLLQEIYIYIYTIM